ncbi:MAG: S8 family peptidase [Hyphomonadaceae bacterium]
MELTGDVREFARAAQQVRGLEFVLGEDLESDEDDRSPAVYLVIPDSTALKQIVSLWGIFQAGQRLPHGLTPWRDVFAQLRDIRPWGPQDRVTDDDLPVLEREAQQDHEKVRIEIELVYRSPAAGVGGRVKERIVAAGGDILSESRIDGALYHALLVDIAVGELRQIIARAEGSLAGVEDILHIRPQSLLHTTAFEETQSAGAVAAAPTLPPIAAVFDAVPLARHPMLDGYLSVEDPFGLEAQAVGRRFHGTAMASAIIHGDRGGPLPAPLRRRVHFINVMYATGGPDDHERFPDRLPADIFQEALVRMKEGANATAPSVVVINASLGDANKPFQGRISGWARVVDYLAHRYGVLFIISAGNHNSALETPNMNVIAFEACNDADKAAVALRAMSQQLHSRRILAPAESINALTVGAHHSDHFPPVAHLGPMVFDVWKNTGMSNVGSGLGPGFGNSVKPDVIAPGGRLHVTLMGFGAGHKLTPQTSNAAIVAGVSVAAPPAPAGIGLNNSARTVGTSVAAALLTGIAARAHEELEAAYPAFANLPSAHRAALLKALIVHCARWTSASAMIASILGPHAPTKSVARKDMIRRFLGYGLAEGQMVLDCATDRATLWATGQLDKEQSHTYQLPLPAVMSGKPQPHELTATVAWFAPPRVGTTSYRGVRLKILEPKESMDALAVSSDSNQPDANQTHRGTVIHRRWSGDKAAALGASSIFKLTVQRELDRIEEAASYGIVVTLAMPNVAGVYTEVRNRVADKPRVAVQP